MKTIKVEVLETLSRIVEVQTYDEYDAINKVEDEYKLGNIVLGVDDLVRVHFDILE